MARQPLSVPFLPYDHLQRLAEDFLRQHHAPGSIPIPIEEIIELQLGLDIIPMPGLAKGCDIYAFPARDLRAIYIDQGVQESHAAKYRFHLAHELAHIVLHADLIRELSFTNFQEWKAVLAEIPEEAHGHFEYQATALAGLLLAPPLPLAEIFANALARLPSGLSVRKLSEIGQQIIEDHLARELVAPPGIVRVRVEKDRLWQQHS